MADKMPKKRVTINDLAEMMAKEFFGIQQEFVRVHEEFAKIRAEFRSEFATVHARLEGHDRRLDRLDASVGDLRRDLKSRWS